MGGCSLPGSVGGGGVGEGTLDSNVGELVPTGSCAGWLGREQPKPAVSRAAGRVQARSFTDRFIEPLLGGRAAECSPRAGRALCARRASLVDEAGALVEHARVLTPKGPARIAPHALHATFPL